MCPSDYFTFIGPEVRPGNLGRRERVLKRGRRSGRMFTFTAANAFLNLPACQRARSPHVVS